MEFRFDPNQEFQVKAIEAVADLFEGQTRTRAVVRFQQGTLSLAAVANRLDLGEADLLANLRSVQRRSLDLRLEANVALTCRLKKI